MNTKILLLALGVVLATSCTTAYKSGQTPDDVYFSPAKQQEAYVDVEERQERSEYRRSSGNPTYYNGNNSDYYNYRDDRFLRLSIANRNRWNYYNDYFMFDNVYNRYDYNIFNPWNSYSGWNNYYYWNNFYNPYTRYALTNPGYYYHPGISGGNYSAQTPVTISRPRAFSPNSYGNRTYSNNNLSMDRNLGNTNSSNNVKQSANTSNNSSRYNNSRYNNSNRNNNSYNNDNNSYNQSRNSNNNTYSQPSRSSDAPVRTYNPSSSGSSSSSSSGSSGGGGGVSRPTRGGN